MKDKLIKILETALNNSELVLNGTVRAGSFNLIDEEISDIKYNDIDVPVYYGTNKYIFNTGDYYKYSNYKEILLSFKNLNNDIVIKTKNTITTPPIKIEGKKRGRLEMFLQSFFGDGVFNFKKEKITLDAHLNKYDRSYIIKYYEFQYPIDEETVNMLYDLYIFNLNKFRENKPMSELDVIAKMVGID